MGAQIVEIAGEKMAVLPVADYERLLDMVEDKEDALAAEDAEKRRAAGEEYIPAEVVDLILGGENPLKVWRKYRGLTQGELGAAVGRKTTMISDLEAGKRDGSGQLWAKLARVLNVAVEDILLEESRSAQE